MLNVFKKFWDTRSPNPMTVINFTERIYCADVGYPMAVIGTASNAITVYNLERKPKFVKNVIPPLKGQLQCLAIFRDKQNQYPNGFALGSVEGRVAIHYLQPKNTKENFTFKCHPYSSIGNENIHDAHGVNDIKIHPVHGTLATVGSDATYAFWDKDSRTKLKSSEKFAQSITKCCFDSKGEIFAYSVGYDWSKGHEYYNPDIKSQIFLKPCFEDLKPK